MLLACSMVIVDDDATKAFTNWTVHQRGPWRRTDAGTRLPLHLLKASARRQA